MSHQIEQDFRSARSVSRHLTVVSGNVVLNSVNIKQARLWLIIICDAIWEDPSTFRNDSLLRRQSYFCLLLSSVLVFFTYILLDGIR